MKEKLCILMIIAMMITMLTACGGKDPEINSEQAGTTSSGSQLSASISNKQDEFTKKIIPLDYAADEQVESLYYRTVIREEDKVVCYEVQPEGEEDSLRIPVSDTVIYIVNDASECQMVKTSFDYKVEGSDPVQVMQYRIFATPSTIIAGGPAELADGEGKGQDYSAEGEEQGNEDNDACNEELPSQESK